MINNASRNTDSLSSHLAECKVTESGERKRQADVVYEAILQHSGKTSKELTDYCNLDRYQIARRTNDLYTEGRVWRVERGTDELLWFARYIFAKQVKPEPPEIAEWRKIQAEYPAGHRERGMIQAQIEKKLKSC